MTGQVHLRSLIDPQLIGALALDGLSASQIANRLNEMLGEKLTKPATRNTVIGLAKRCGVGLNPPAVAAPGSRRDRRKREKPRKAKPAGPGTSSEQAIESLARLEAHCDGADIPTLRVSLLDLKHDSCRWPLGDPFLDDFAYCGMAATRGAYCAGHALLGYQPPESRMRRKLVAQAEAPHQP
jgi:GcrA cell cycle regulator